MSNIVLSLHILILLWVGDP